MIAWMILLSFALGIATSPWLAWSGLLGGCLAGFTLMGSTHLYHGFRFRWIHQVPIPIVFFMLGAVMAKVRANDESVAWSPQTQEYRGVVAALPRLTAKYQQLKVVFPTGTKALVSLPLDCVSADIAPGTTLVFRGKVHQPSNWPGSDFDYASYLRCQGIHGVAYPYAWQLEDRDETLVRALPWTDRTWLWLQRLSWSASKQMDNRQLSRSDYGLLCSLVLGNRMQLTTSQREDFQQIGASHVLALSGMHLGVLFALVSFLFLRYYGTGRRRFLMVGLVLLFLWSYALLAGLSPSLLRAVVMMSLMLVAQTLYRGLSGSSLLVRTLLVLLVADPAMIYDVGAQLSAVAVAGLVWFCPRSKNGVVQLFYVSLTAWMATMPLQAFYFHSVQPWSVLSSLLVVPMVTVVLVLGFLLLVVSLTGVSVLADAVGVLLHVILTVLHRLGDWLTGLPYSSVDDVHIGWWEVPLLYAVMVGAMVAVRWWTKKKS